MPRPLQGCLPRTRSVDSTRYLIRRPDLRGRGVNLAKSESCSLHAAWRSMFRDADFATDHSSIKMARMPVATAMPHGPRVDRFTYAIRNIVAEAKKVEAAGGRSATSISATRSRSGSNAAAPDRGRRKRACATATTATLRRRHPASARSRGRRLRARGVPVSPDRVLITSGTSEGIELALTALVDEGEEVLVPSPTYPLYTAVLAKIGAEPRLLPHRSGPSTGCRISITCARSSRPDARARRDRSEQSDRRVYPDAVRRALIDFAERARPGRSWPTRSTAIWGTTARSRRWRRSIPTRRSSRSRACRRRISRRAGAPAGWSSARRRGSTARWRRSRSWPTAACAARARCSTRSRRRSPATARIR